MVQISGDLEDQLTFFKVNDNYFALEIVMKEGQIIT